MPRYSKTLTPAAQAAFLADLSGGALVEAAARRAGVAVSSLYCRRGRDPAFAAGWDEALSRSRARGRPAGDGAGPGRKRRARLDGWRRGRFLAALEATCNTSDSARWAGIDRSAIYRRIARDPAFAADCAAALARGYAALGGELAEQREAAAALLRRPLEPTGEPTADFDEAMKLLARWERPDGSLGRRFVRHGRQRGWTFEKAMEALDRRLRWLGIPILGEGPPEG